MNITDMLGTPVNDPADFEIPTHSACSLQPPPERAEPPPQRRSRFRTAALVMAAAIFGAGAGWYFASSLSNEPIPPVAISPAAESSNQVGEFAEMFTALYLSGVTSPDDLASMYTGAAPPRATTWVNQSAALLVKPLGDGFWEVTIAVDSLELVDGAYESAGIQYFKLTVSEQVPYPVAVSAPARIPAPPVAGRAAIPSFTGAVPADQATAATRFINGYLTGQEDTARYVTATARIQPFAEPPYESISITSMGSDARGYVEVALAAVTHRGATHTLEYTLEFSFDAGVWEVSSLTSPISPQ